MLTSKHRIVLCGIPYSFTTTVSGANLCIRLRGTYSVNFDVTKSKLVIFNVLLNTTTKRPGAET